MSNIQSEVRYVRFVRPESGPTHWLKKVVDGICVESVYQGYVDTGHLGRIIEEMHVPITEEEYNKEKRVDPIPLGKSKTMEATKHTMVKVTIVLNEDEAKWLKSYLQNSAVQGADEDPTDAHNRNALWTILDNAGVA